MSNSERPVKVEEAKLPYDRADEETIKNVVDMVNEAANIIASKPARGSTREASAYNKLHQAVLMGFKLRGAAFKEVFYRLCHLVSVHQKTIFAPATVSLHLDKLPNDQREFMLVFLNMLGRFVRCENKPNFYRTNDVGRLLARVNDEELRGLLKELFIVP